MIRLSIITVTFNAGKTLERTLESLIAYLDEEVELIIIDGASNDNTVEIIKKYDSSISYWISEKDLGVYDAMNKGASKAKGNYLAFMNADDCYAEGILKELKSIVRECEADIIYGATNLFIDSIIVGVKQPTDMQSIPYKMPFCHQSCLIKRTTFWTNGGYDIRYKILSDYDLILKIYKQKSFKYLKIKSVIACFSLGGVSSNYKMASKERYLIHKKNKLNVLRTLFEFVSWNFTGFIRVAAGEKIEPMLRKLRLKLLGS